MRKLMKTISILAISIGLTACGGSSKPEAYPASAELAELGYGEYLGAASPVSTEVDGEWTHLAFDPAVEGPICLTGRPFQVSYRDGPSDEVLVFQQGGGACWDDYMAAFQDALDATSRPWAPWYAIPADDKPFMRLTVAELIVAALDRLDPAYPELDAEQTRDLAGHAVQLRRELGEGREPRPT